MGVNECVDVCGGLGLAVENPEMLKYHGLIIQTTRPGAVAGNTTVFGATTSLLKTTPFPPQTPPDHRIHLWPVSFCGVFRVYFKRCPVLRVYIRSV